MADDTSAQNQVIDAMIDALKASTTPDIIQAQQILARRLALSGGVIPSRIPAPKNITEIGGYFNLLESLDQNDLRAQVLASILGVAGSSPSLDWPDIGLELWFVKRANDRPTGLAQPTIPVDFTMRSDFADAFASALDAVHSYGCVLPLMPTSPLPPLTSIPSNLLAYVGRELRIAPLAALNDPASDPLAVGNPSGGGGNHLYARPVGPATVPIASTDWELWTCLGAQCTKQPYAGATALALVDLEPILAGAGWYHPSAIVAPTSLSAPGDWNRWSNVTGLEVGIRYGDELRRLFRSEQIAASSVRDRPDWSWNGTQFTP
jgi:hypothetical protein